MIITPKKYRLLLAGVDDLDRIGETAVGAGELLESFVGIHTALDGVKHLTHLDELVTDDVIFFVKSKAGDITFGHFQITDALGGSSVHCTGDAAQTFAQVFQSGTDGETAFSEDGLPIGAGLEDLGKGLRSITGTMYGTADKGVRYLEMAEGYVTEIALDEEDMVIGYKFVKLGQMLDAIAKGEDANEAVKKFTGTYGRFADAAKTINPRHQ